MQQYFWQPWYPCLHEHDIFYFASRYAIDNKENKTEEDKNKIQKLYKQVRFPLTKIL